MVNALFNLKFLTLFSFIDDVLTVLNPDSGEAFKYGSTWIRIRNTGKNWGTENPILLSLFTIQNSCGLSPLIKLNQGCKLLLSNFSSLYFMSTKAGCVRNYYLPVPCIVSSGICGHQFRIVWLNLLFHLLIVELHSPSLVLCLWYQ